MAFTKIFTIIDDESSLERKFLFGNIQPHNKTKTYSKGDIVYGFTANGISVIRAKNNNTTGPITSSNWESLSINDFINESAVVSSTQPSSDSVNIWMKPVRTATYNLPNKF